MPSKVERIKDLSKDINIPLNQIFDSCIKLKDGICTSTLNQLEKAGAVEIIDIIYNNCGSIRSIRQALYNECSKL